jgi:hypothetical protein
MLKHGARNEFESHAIERRKPSRGSLCLGITKGHAAAPQWSGAAVLPASEWNMCKRTIEIPQELWEILSSPRQFPVGVPGYQLQASAAHSSAEERTHECNRGTAKQRQRSEARRTAGSHSVLIVPSKLANSTQLEPVEGSETSNHGTAFEKHGECIEIRITCPRNGSG